MRILLTNDDGIAAPGLSVLEGIARELSDDVWVVAPEHEQSGASRALTLHMPLRVRELEAKRFAVSGTPSDCVMLAVREIMADTAPDLILSGVNRGQNLAEDVTLSGTVAGALKGRALGIPSVALSQAFFNDGDDRDVQSGQVPWATAQQWGTKVLRPLISKGWPRDITLNVNFPSVQPEGVTGIEITRQGVRDHFNVHAEKRVDLRGYDYYWLGFGAPKSNPPQGTDLHAVYRGKISITPLSVDLTHEATLADLSAVDWAADLHSPEGA